MTDLSGQVVLVTGGATAPGRAVVDRLVAAHASVEVVDPDEEGALAVARTYGGALGPVGARGADVGDPDALRPAVHGVVADRGRLDALVHLVPDGGGDTPASVTAVVDVMRPHLRATRGVAVVAGTDPDALATMTLDGVGLRTVAATDETVADEVLACLCPREDRDATIPRFPRAVH